MLYSERKFYFPILVHHNKEKITLLCIISFRVNTEWENFYTGYSKSKQKEYTNKENV